MKILRSPTDPHLGDLHQHCGFQTRLPSNARIPFLVVLSKALANGYRVVTRMSFAGGVLGGHRCQTVPWFSEYLLSRLRKRGYDFHIWNANKFGLFLYFATSHSRFSRNALMKPT